MPTGEVGSVMVVDAADSEALRDAARDLDGLGVRVVLGVDEAGEPSSVGAAADRFDLCVASPGVPPHSALMAWAESVSEEVISEIEFAYRRSDRPWIAVTGTNGKTSTTALITHLLLTAGIPARAVGNIGEPAITVATDISAPNVLVAEVSSFQLALTQEFHPTVAVMLNITPDHLDWHQSMAAYVAAKERVFANMTADDVAVIDVDDSGSAHFAQQVAARGVPVARVSRSQRGAGTATVVDGVLMLETSGGPVRLVGAGELRIRGKHNVSNALAAAAAAEAFGVSAVALREGLRSFMPIEHRLESVAVVGGVEWVNDSKATNPDAVIKALTAFEGQPLTVLVGGRNKENDFTALAEALSSEANRVVVFGEAADELAGALSLTATCFTVAASMREAVQAARELAEPGSVVLLSPACASFDEFLSYEQRGSVFKEIVLHWAAEENLA